MGEKYVPKGQNLSNEHEGTSVCFCGAEHSDVEGSPLVPWAEIEAKIESGEYIVVDGQVVVAVEYDQWKKGLSREP